MEMDRFQERTERRAGKGLYSGVHACPCLFFKMALVERSRFAGSRRQAHGGQKASAKGSPIRLARNTSDGRHGQDGRTAQGMGTHYPLRLPETAHKARTAAGLGTSMAGADGRTAGRVQEYRSDS